MHQTGLFPSEKLNLLPYDGEAIYHGKIFDDETSNHYFDQLLKIIEWEYDQAKIFGKIIQTKRKVAWYGDDEFSYTYSNITKKAKFWIPLLQEIKSQVEINTNAQYNSCLLNLYHDGSEGMAWHSDGEKDLVESASIASVTFGAERKFCFKHKISKLSRCKVLENGSLLDMRGETQQHWLHRLPPTTKIQSIRINLTFRLIQY